jgi:chromosome segregation ATPase
MRGGNPALADPLADSLLTTWQQKDQKLDERYKQLEVESKELKVEFTKLDKKREELGRKIDELEEQITENTINSEKEEYIKKVKELRANAEELQNEMNTVSPAWKECAKKLRQNLEAKKEILHQRSLNDQTLEPTNLK